MATHHHQYYFNYSSNQGITTSYLNPDAQEFHPFIHTFSSSSSSTSIISTTNNNNNNNNNNFPYYYSLHQPSTANYQNYPFNQHHPHDISLMQPTAHQLQLGLGQPVLAPPMAHLSPGPTSHWSRGSGRGRRRRRWGSGCSSNNERKQGHKCKNNNGEWSCKGSSRRRSSSCGQNIMLVKPNGKETTAMIRNIPNQYTREMLIKFLDEFCRLQNQKLDLNHHQPLGFDFLYLPMDFKRDANKGYAFVNFTHSIALWRLHLAFSDRRWEHCKSSKVCKISCAAIQGKEGLVEHFGTSTFRCNHEDYLPVCFSPPRDGSGASVAETTIGRRFSLSKLSSFDEN